MPYFGLQQRPGAAREKGVVPRLLQIQRDRESFVRAHHTSRRRCDQRPQRPHRRDTRLEVEEGCPRRRITTVAGHATTSKRWRWARSRSLRLPRSCRRVHAPPPPVAVSRLCYAVAPNPLLRTRVESRPGADADAPILRDRPHHLAVTRLRVRRRTKPPVSGLDGEEAHGAGSVARRVAAPSTAAAIARLLTATTESSQWAR
jgi:hypothetical protein